MLPAGGLAYTGGLFLIEPLSLYEGLSTIVFMPPSLDDVIIDGKST
jgi:hypothetical protein